MYHNLLKLQAGLIPVLVCFALTGMGFLLPFSQPAMAADKGKDALIIGYGDYHSKPFIARAGDSVVGGLIMDIGDELSERLNRPVIYKQYNRKRFEDDLSSAVIHLNCATNPAWLNNPEGFEWTYPLYQDRDLLVAKKELAPTIKTIDDVIGKRIGTILGFKYPGAVGNLFRAEKAKRIDVSNLQQGLKMLERDRVDLVLNSEMRLRSALATSGMAKKVAFTPIVENRFFYYCALSRLSPVSFLEFQSAIEDMIADGFFRRLEETYLGS